MKRLAALNSATFVTFILIFFSACGSNSNIRDISANNLANQLERNDMLILDVRTAQEFAAGHVPGATNMPHTSVKSQLDKLQGYKNKTIVIYCKSGRRAAMARQTLTDAGFKQLLHLNGDMDSWQAGNFPIEK